MKILLFHRALLLPLLLTRSFQSVVPQDINDRSATIVIGQDDSSIPPFVGWTDGVCYPPLLDLQPDDRLEFRFEAHNLYQLKSQRHFFDCNFTEATLLASPGESPYTYTIATDYTNQLGQEEILYFACAIGNHCASGTQKLRVAVTPSLGGERDNPVSSFVTGLTTEECHQLQTNAAAVSEIGQAQANGKRSYCHDPVEVTPGTYTRTCLSGPATLTPGGVVNRLFVLDYPFPKDHRVALGQRVFDFVVDDPHNPTDYTPVSHHQMYIHHLAGRVVFSQGAESLRQMAPDAPFPPPYARLTGNDGPTTIFHLIDLRNVTDWLSCIECRCQKEDDDEGTMMEAPSDVPGNATGGVSCCSNCTNLVGPPLDYRMRYNVTYRDLAEEQQASSTEGANIVSVQDVDLLVADMAPAVDMVLEYNVPQYSFLPPAQRDPYNRFVQRLERVAPFNELFQVSFFAGPYRGPPQVTILRCVAHMHVSAVTQYLEDAETGERYCTGNPVYATEGLDKGFVTAISVDNHYDPPMVIPADRMVRFVTEYNATHVHTGVMGYLFVFVVGEHTVHADEMKLTVPFCQQATCDAGLLPQVDMTPYDMPATEQETPAQGDADSDCVDTLEDSPSCTFGGLCDCEAFVNAPESTGCDGFYSSAMGDVEVRSVCAKYCGCDVSEVVDEEQANTGVDCVDTLAEHPACIFADMCDCKEFINHTNSTGCGGVFNSTWGSVQVEDVCAKECGCAATKSGGTRRGMQGNCVDTLATSPACTFGGLCDCETYVNAPESTGCGGIFTSTFGETEVNSLCPAYCGACVEVSVEELFEEAYTEVLGLHLRKLCQYDTATCRAALSNVHSCGTSQAGLENAHPLVQMVVTKHGRSMAQGSAKLGEPSLHAGQADQDVLICPGSQDPLGEVEGAEEDGSEDGIDVDVGAGGDGNGDDTDGDEEASTGSGFSCEIAVTFVIAHLVFMAL